MLVGLTFGVCPVVLLLASSFVWKFDLDSVDKSILIPCIVSPFFVPVTLGYSVLVSRIFDVGVFLRHGLLAARTVAAVRTALMFWLLWRGLTLFGRADLASETRWLYLTGHIVGAAAVAVGADRLRVWLDRRLFQDALKSELLLHQLAEDVKRMTNPETLLRNLTSKISEALRAVRADAFVASGAGYIPAFAASGTSIDPTAIAALRDRSEPIEREGGVYVPLTTGSDLHAVISLGAKQSEEPYSGRELRLLRTVASQAALTLENSRLTVAVAEEAAQRQKISSELEIARQVQERLFPKRAPAIPGVDVWGRCLPAQTVGGDYYDFLELPGGAIGLAIGDIAGKGVPAALLMAGLQASLRGLTMAGVSDIADLMAKLNTLVFDATPANRFATFFYCTYEPETRRLRYSSAGHNPAFVYRASTGEGFWLRTPGAALGLRRNAAYRKSEMTLLAGDCLVLYTDGITEARTAAGEEFGEDRMAQIVKTNSSRVSAVELVDALVSGAVGFAEGAPQHDDITVIAVLT